MSKNAWSKFQDMFIARTLPPEEIERRKRAHEEYLFQELVHKSIYDLRLSFTGFHIDHARRCVDFKDPVNVRGYNGSELPFQFGTVRSMCQFESCELRTIKHLPTMTSHGSLYVHRCKLNTLDYDIINYKHDVTYQFSDNGITHFTNKIVLPYGKLTLMEPGIKSLKNIHHFINVRSLTLSCPIDSNVLGLLLIPSLEALSFVFSKEYAHLNQVMDIVCRHLDTRNILACQEELIDAGFGDYAKL